MLDFQGFLDGGVGDKMIFIFMFDNALKMV